MAAHLASHRGRGLWCWMGTESLVSPPLVEWDTEDKVLAYPRMLSWFRAEQALGPKSSDLESVLFPPSPASLFYQQETRAEEASWWHSKGSRQRRAAGLGDVVWASTSAPCLMHLYPECWKMC